MCVGLCVSVSSGCVGLCVSVTVGGVSSVYVGLCVRDCCRCE